MPDLIRKLPAELRQKIIMFLIMMILGPCEELGAYPLFPTLECSYGRWDLQPEYEKCVAIIQSLGRDLASEAEHVLYAFNTFTFPTYYEIYLFFNGISSNRNTPLQRIRVYYQPRGVRRLSLLAERCVSLRHLEIFVSKSFFDRLGWHPETPPSTIELKHLKALPGIQCILNTFGHLRSITLVPDTKMFDLPDHNHLEPLSELFRHLNAVIRGYLSSRGMLETLERKAKRQKRAVQQKQAKAEFCQHVNSELVGFYFFSPLCNSRLNTEN
jgi:hypothetical protein